MPVSSTTRLLSETAQVLRIGTRDSKLALIQTYLVVELIQAAHPGLAVEVETMKTIGDKIQDVALRKFGDKGLFTKELETALEAKAINMIVHSLKDMPTHLPPNMKILAITEREDPRDAVIMHKCNQGRLLEDLPEGSVIGTGSVRRVAQLRRLYPHLRFADIRGNLTTRMAKLDAADSPFAALILAVAGMRRQGMGARISQPLDAVLYAVGQGALGIEVLENDTDTQALLHGCLDHRATRLACLAERELMRRLEGGCSVPIGVTTAWCGADELRLCAVVVSPDGAEEVRLQAQAAVASDADAERLGARLARDMCAAGASRILAAIHHPPPPSAEVVAQATARK
ncbi:hypothetical protein LPJ66_007567 [Kickxella alabastrina]|uniref:Uncharacterized protein n=1 Tax=Kickxella alabastrina TaxID=61397 RepID=A0ACC1I928_9FUNG|nr:hypothetical protein LPJ66_007567 [Kickxella alabastrina]